MLTVFAGAAEYGAQPRSERTTAVLAVKRANGQRVGTIPYGFDLGDDGQTLVANETEQAVLTEIREKRSRGWTLQRLASDLSDRGIATKKGIFKLSSDASLSEFQEYAAIGSGGDYASGAMHCLYDDERNPRNIAQRAVEAGIEFDAYCGGTVLVLEVK